MDKTSIIDIQYATITLQDLRCEPMKSMNGRLVARRTYWSKLDAIQRELRYLMRLLEVLSSDDRSHIVKYPQWIEVAESKCVAARARSSVRQLDNAIDHLRNDINNGPFGMSLDTGSILDDARTWNDSFLYMLDDVAPLDKDSLTLNRSSRLFYDTMWDLEGELAELGTHLAVISTGMTVEASNVLSNAVENPPLSSGKDSNNLPSPAQAQLAKTPRTESAQDHSRRHATDEIRTTGNQTKRGPAEDSTSVSPCTKPKDGRGTAPAQGSLNLNLDLSPNLNLENGESKCGKSRLSVASSKPVDQGRPRANQAAHPDQVSQLNNSQNNSECDFEDHPDDSSVHFDTPNYKSRRDATAGLNSAHKQDKNKTRAHSPHTSRHNKVYTHDTKPLDTRKSGTHSQTYYAANRPSELLDSPHGSVFTINTTMQREFDEFLAWERANATIRATHAPANTEVKSTGPDSPQPSFPASQLTKGVTTPPTNSSKPRRTLTQIAVGNRKKSASESKYRGPTVEDDVKTGQGSSRGIVNKKGKKTEKVVSPRTTTLKELRAMERSIDDTRMAGDSDGDILNENVDDWFEASREAEGRESHCGMK